MNRDAVRLAQSPGHDGKDQREGDHGGQVKARGGHPLHTAHQGQAALVLGGIGTLVLSW